jgi:ArsR family transcriptional regulator
MLSEKTLNDVAEFYKVLADNTRLKIINALNESELCVCDISNLLNMTKSAVSHQLQNLKSQNLISSRKAGKIVYYSLADEHVKIVYEISLQHVMEKKHETNA